MVIFEVLCLNLVSAVLYDTAKKITKSHPEALGIYLESIEQLSNKYPELEIDHIQNFLEDEGVKKAITDYLRNPDAEKFLSDLKNQFSIMFDDDFLSEDVESILIDLFQIIESKIEANPTLRNYLEISYLKKIDKAVVEIKKDNDWIAQAMGNEQIEDQYDFFKRVCKLQHKKEVEFISAKYIEELFVPRKKYDDDFQQFLKELNNNREYNKNLPVKNREIEEHNKIIRSQNQETMKKYPHISKKQLLDERKLIKETPYLKPIPIKNCFFVMGEAGIGKTNQLCYLSKKYEEIYPVLFLNGSRMLLTDKDIEQCVTDSFTKILSINSKNVLDSLEKTCSAKNITALFFIDAINECLNLDLMRVCLGNILSYNKDKNIAFIVSCRDIDWRFFETENEIKNCIFDVEKPNLSLLSDEEFKEAWARYKEYFKLDGDISEEIVSICRQPIMLRFFSEAYQGGKVPEQDIKRIEIFNNYWDKKLDGTGEKRAAQNFLFSIADAMVTQKKAELIETEVEEVTDQTTDEPQTTFSKVLSENIILYKEFDSRTKENKIGFTYEAFFEYVIARYFLKKYGTLNDEDLLTQFKQVVETISDFRNLMGATEYIILLLEDTEENGDSQKVYVRMIEILSEYQDKNLRQEAITVIRKLKSVGGIENSLQKLADDNNVEINKGVYDIFKQNYEFFDVTFQRNILCILATKGSNEFLQTPISFVLDYYNRLPSEIQSLIIYFSDCNFINTKRKMSQLLLSETRLPPNIYESAIINLIKEEDRIIRFNILESLSINIDLLDKQNLTFCLNKLIEDVKIDHVQLAKLIEDKQKIIPEKIIIDFIDWSLNHCDYRVKLPIIFLIKAFIENKIISLNEIYFNFIDRLVTDADEDVSQKAEELLFPLLS
ncbi:hypothetical protein HWN40_06610 [Methanolobus zinderi]|uniref:NACHT domain-containing protein n=1 Tax=Methanolobus zinderi TaxID=536044 RepID=A0A7D5E7X8_9EURY|nr:hypothetical protein [Methanolobus zinderi]QLC49939.1 hypothetical protein HWN40_06610 [Methanolobus zinderi]